MSPAVAGARRPLTSLVLACLLAGLLLLPATAVAQNSDTNAPVLQSVAVSTTGVNTDSELDAERTVTVTLRVTDDLSGFSGTCLYLRSPTLPAGGTHSAATCSGTQSGTATDRTVTSKIIVRRYAYPGTWTLDPICIGDLAGNSRCYTATQTRDAGATPVEVRDITKPVVQCATVPTAWSATNVSVACTASDPSSGLASAADASFSLVTTVAAGQESATAPTGSREVCDRAGNCTTAGPFEAKVDRKGPAITVTTPAKDAVFSPGSVVAARYACLDGGSGTDGCAGPVADGAPIDTGDGPHAFTVTASDALGNASQVTVPYSAARAEQATLEITAPGAGRFGQHLTITTSGGSGTGARTFTTTGDACTITGGKLEITKGAGTCSVTASKAGDADFEPAVSAAQAVTVGKADQPALVITAPATATFGDRVTVSTTGGSGAGAVRYEIATPTACALGDEGLSITSGTTDCTLTATMAGDADHEPVTSSAHTIDVARAEQAPLRVDAPATATYGDRLDVSTTGGSGAGAVSYDLTTRGACELVDGRLAITSGTTDCTLTATKAADADHGPATSAAHTVAVGKARLTVTATDAAMTYADPVPALTARTTGWVAGDTATTSRVTGAAALGTTATSASKAGSYPITAAKGTLASEDYAFTFGGGTMTVAKREATIRNTGDTRRTRATAGNVDVGVAATVTRATGDLGDLALAGVTWVVRTASGAASASVSGPVSSGGTAAGIASVPTSAEAYRVEARIDPANEYWTSGTDTGALSVVVDSTDRGASSASQSGGPVQPDGAVLGARDGAAAPSRLERSGRARVTATRSGARVSTGLRIACPAGGPECTGRVTLKLVRRAAAGRSERRFLMAKVTPLRIAAGTARELRFDLSPSAASMLRKRGARKVVVRGSIRSGGGRPVIHDAELRLPAGRS